MFTAEWRMLAFANYLVDPGLLQQYVPSGTEIDLWEGQCYISLVAFSFRKCHMLGIPMPLYQDFPEINLRFYVKRKTAEGEWQHGVVFLREIAAKPFLAIMANAFFGEHYKVIPCRQRHFNLTDSISSEYTWGNNRFLIHARPVARALVRGLEEFLVHRLFGFTAFSRRKTGWYEVSHPHWKAFNPTDIRIECDFSVFGRDFTALTSMKPVSVGFYEGSPVSFVKRGSFRS